MSVLSKVYMLTVPDGRYEIIKLYCLEEIISFYSAYIYTLTKSPFEKIFINPKEVNINIPVDRIWEEAAQRDRYLNKYKNEKINLAKDIHENGTYFPFWATSKNGVIMVEEGIHRMESIKMYIDKFNSWEYNMLVYIIPDTLYEDINLEPFESEIFFPIYNIEKDWHKNLFGKHFELDEYNKTMYNSINRDQPVLIKIHTVQEYINAIFIWHKLLRHSFFKYKEAYGKDIPVSKFINNREDIKNAF